MQTLPPHIAQAVAAARVDDLLRQAAASRSRAQVRRARRAGGHAATQGRCASQADGTSPAQRPTDPASVSSGDGAPRGAWRRLG